MPDIPSGSPTDEREKTLQDSPGAVGFLMKSDNAIPTSAAIDFFRIWNSAKTFPGV